MASFGAQMEFVLERLRRLTRYVQHHPIGTVIFVLVAWFVTWGALHPLTPEQIKAQQDLVARQQEDQKVEAANEKFLCHLRTVCSQFAGVRQDCATAGNYDNCVSIKMGDDAAYTDQCTNDGKLAFPPDKLPSTMRCWGLEAGDAFK